MSDEIRALLEKYKAGRLSLDQARDGILGLHKTPSAQIDLDRKRRCGMNEVIYGEGKTSGQIQEILGAMVDQGLDNILVTRLDSEKYRDLKDTFPGTYDPLGRTFHYGSYPDPQGQATILCAGTSDLPVAREALETLKSLGVQGMLIADVGVAGIHRLLHYEEDIQKAQVLIVIAGMEGALLSVVGGLASCPLIGVPTSVGYGANFKGLSSLLSMLNSCAAGSCVVNIDNGFGAAVLASRILQVEKNPGEV